MAEKDEEMFEVLEKICMPPSDDISSRSERSTRILAMSLNMQHILVEGVEECTVATSFKLPENRLDLALKITECQHPRKECIKCLWKVYLPSITDRAGGQAAT